MRSGERYSKQDWYHSGIVVPMHQHALMQQIV